MMQEIIIGPGGADSSLLNALYQWGLALIRIIQSVETPGLTAAVKLITRLGSELFYIPAVLLILWCIDEKKGLRLGLLVIFSGWVNAAFKLLLKQPRPYNLDPSVGRAFEPSYGVPSGHAQGSLVFWVPLAKALSPKTGALPAAAGAALIVLIIGFTRLYLGLHFPTDLLAGWLLGGLILWGCFHRSRRSSLSWVEGAEARLNRLGLRGKLLASAALSFLMIVLTPGDVTLGAMFLGLGGGYALMRKYCPFSAGAPVKGRRPGFGRLSLRFAVGLAIAGLIYIGLKAILPGEGSSLYNLCRFFRYAVLGFWASLGAPWVFLKLRLA